MKAFITELTGTAFLLAAVVGSGIMGERLAGGNVAVALLANSLATGAALVALILTFGPISGAHFNPVVSFADASQGGLTWPSACGYAVAQVLGATIGVGAADYMFELPIYAWSQHARSGLPQMFSEGIATFGLLAVIWGCSRRRSDAVPFAVGAYITGAYWFTSSTSFANPAVTLARSLTDTFAGIRPVDVPAFVVAQAIGGAAATALFRWLVPALPRTATDVVVPHRRKATQVERVIFACVHNAGRSQMAARFFSEVADPARAEAISAGTQPGERIHPEVVNVMREVGMDVSGNRPQRLTEELARSASLLITMGCGDECPYVPGLHRDDWALQDPKGLPLDEVRRIRDEIRARVQVLVDAHRWRRPT